MATLKVTNIKNESFAGDQLYLKTDGKIGIGTTSPLGRIHVHQTDSGTVDGLIITNTSTSNNGLSIGVSSSEEAFFWNGSDTSMNFATNNQERLRITSTGLVGIGDTSPDRTLHVNSGSSNECALFESTDTEVTLEFKDTTGTASLKCRNDFRLNNSTGELLRITSVGKVGINNTAPNSILHIGAADNTNHEAILTLNNGGASGQEAGIEWLYEASTTPRAKIHLNASDQSLTFSTANSPALTIDSSQQVGIGRTDPGHKLAILGGASNQLEVKGTEADIWLTSTGGGSDKAWRILGSTGGNTHRFRIYDNANSKEPFYIIGSNGSNTQHVHVNSGNLVFDAAGTGIDFGATGEGTATSSESELLDDYEEGNHLVTDPGGNWTIGTGSGAYKYIRYIKIGNQCTVMGQVYCGAGSGVLKFSLPYAAGFSGATIGGAAQDLAYTTGGIRLYQWDVPDNVVTACMMTYNGQNHCQINVSFDNANSSTLDGDNGAYVAYSLTYPTV